MGFRDQNNTVAPIDDGGSFDTDTNVNSVTSTSEAAANALAAANSAAAALVSKNSSDSNLALTNADVVSTNDDVVLTNADVVSTNADVLLAEADKVQTGLDRIATNADVVLTNADVVTTNADVLLAEADKVQTGLDRIATNADVVLTNADVLSTNADVILAEADKVQTGLDRIATNADVVLTNADVVLAEADKVQTGLDRVATNADVVTTNADVLLTNADVILAEADKVQTGLDRIATNADVVLTNADVVTTNADVILAAASKTAAALSATGASDSQIAAASSAASAAAVFDNFDDTYLGSKSSEPTVDNDGNTLAVGALFYNSSTQGMFIWTGSEWVAASAAGGASLNNFSYTATAGQTAFSGSDENSNTLSYTVDNIIVTLNGVVLEGGGTDYTATNGTSVVLASSAAVSDEINIVAFKSFTTADMVSASNGGTFQGNVDFAAGIDVTGNITVTGTVDGRDVAADGTRLDGMEDNANVTDTTNVAAAGALMDSEVTNLAQVKVFDTTDYATAAQGVLAASATQPGDLGTAATSAATDFVAVTGDTMTGDLALSAADVTFGDNDKAIFGAGSDLRIYHNTAGFTGNIIESPVTNLYIRSNNLYFQKGDGTENNVIAISDGAVTLSYDNAPKLATTATGVDITGTLTAESLGIGATPGSYKLFVKGTDASDSGDITTRLEAGTVSSNSAVNNVTLDLTARAKTSGGTALAQNTEIRALGSASGNGGTLAFYTDNSSAAITQRMVIDSSGNVGIGTGSPNSYSGYKTLTLNGTSGSLLDFEVNGTVTGEMYADASTGMGLQAVGSRHIQFKTNNTERMRIDSNGDLSLYEDTGTTPKFFWDSSAESLGIGNAAPATALDITGTSGIRLNNGEQLSIKSGANAGDNARIAASSSSGIEFAINGSSGVQAIIDSSGNVGIGSSTANHFGTAGVASVLGVKSTSGGLVSISATGTSFSGISLGTDSIRRGGVYSLDGSVLGFYTNPTNSGTSITEAMRIDSSGALLVGKTAENFGTQGVAFRGSPSSGASGSIFTRDGANVAAFNRLTSDGTIVSFSKDGGTVGSIGTYGGRVYLADDSQGGISVSSASKTLFSTNSVGSVEDNAMDIGSSSYRFKDLYLSGGVYLGGTGAANLLDDYEEGTWTPALSGSVTAGDTTYHNQFGRYEKIGRRVTFRGRIQTNLQGTLDGEVKITGLPFTSNASASSYGSVHFGYGWSLGITAGESLTGFVNLNSTLITMLVWNSTSGSDALDDAELTNGADLMFHGSYMV